MNVWYVHFSVSAAAVLPETKELSVFFLLSFSDIRLLFILKRERESYKMKAARGTRTKNERADTHSNGVNTPVTLGTIHYLDNEIFKVALSKLMSID
jgi:hypothetical protein